MAGSSSADGSGEVSSFRNFAAFNFPSLFFPSASNPDDGAGSASAASGEAAKECLARRGSDDPSEVPAAGPEEHCGPPSTPGGVSLGLALPPRPLSWAEEEARPSTNLRIPAVQTGTSPSLQSHGSPHSGRLSPTTGNGPCIDTNTKSPKTASEEEVLQGVSSHVSSPAGPAGFRGVGAPVETVATPDGASTMLPSSVAGSSSSSSRPVQRPEPVERGQSRGLTVFAEHLASTTQLAPKRLAERLVEQLQQLCLEEAGMGQSSFTWDIPLPAGSRTFMHEVAREFVSHAEALGFEQVKWWNGREWRQSQGRYHILYDTVYDKYHMKMRVRWLDCLPPEEIELIESPPRRFTHQRNWSAASATGLPGQSQEQAVFEQFQQTLELHRQWLEEQLLARQAPEAVPQVQEQMPAAEVQAPAAPPTPSSDRVFSSEVIIEEAPRIKSAVEL